MHLATRQSLKSITLATFDLTLCCKQSMIASRPHFFGISYAFPLIFGQPPRTLLTLSSITAASLHIAHYTLAPSSKVHLVLTSVLGIYFWHLRSASTFGISVWHDLLAIFVLNCGWPLFVCKLAHSFNTTTGYQTEAKYLKEILIMKTVSIPGYRNAIGLLGHCLNTQP